MKTVVVTGANGLLGQKLVKLLARDASTRTIATARQPLAYPAHGITFAELDITDHTGVDRLIRSFKPDWVINTAAATNVDWCELNPEACFKINTEAVAHLARACEKTGAAIMQLSTDFIFNGTYGPLDESAHPDPVNIYGHSKLKAEEVVMQSGIPWCIVRTVLVYGVAKPLNRLNIVLWVKESLEKGKSIQVVTDQYRTPTLAEDLAQGCLLAYRHNATGIYHISGEEMMTPYEMAIQTARFFSMDESLIRPATASTFQQPARRPPKTGFIIEKAKKHLGYQPHPFIEGLRIVQQQLKDG
jgi:dTDP-4-dehydrorhamnose reductase